MRREGKEPSPDLKALYISLILTVINSLKDEGAEGRETATETMQCFSLEHTGLLLQDEAVPQIPSLPWEIPLGDSDPSLFHVSMSWTWQLPFEDEICHSIMELNTRVSTWKSHIWPAWDAWCAPIYFCFKGFSAWR